MTIFLWVSACTVSDAFFFGSWALEHRLNSCGTWLVALQHVGSSWIRDQTHVSCFGRQIIPEGPGKPSDAFLPLLLRTEYIFKKSVLRFFITDFMQFDYDVPWCSFFLFFFFAVCWAFLISGFIVFIKFGTFSVFFTSNIFLFLLSRTPNRYVRSLGLEQFLYYAICRILISFKTDIFLLYCITSKELKAYGDQATRLVNLKISKMYL